MAFQNLLSWCRGVAICFWNLSRKARWRQKSFQRHHSMNPSQPPGRRQWGGGCLCFAGGSNRPLRFLTRPPRRNPCSHPPNANDPTLRLRRSTFRLFHGRLIVRPPHWLQRCPNTVLMRQQLFGKSSKPFSVVTTFPDSLLTLQRITFLYAATITAIRCLTSAFKAQLSAVTRNFDSLLEEIIFFSIR